MQDQYINIPAGTSDEFTAKPQVIYHPGVVYWSEDVNDFREEDIVVYSSFPLDSSLVDRYKLGEITTITNTEIHIENLISDQEEIYRTGSIRMSRLYRANDESTATIRRVCGYISTP